MSTKREGEGMEEWETKTESQSLRDSITDKYLAPVPLCLSMLI